ncbi:MAG: hypothetical protein GXP33_12255, partial [Spirochaetes bacterium]|nr:hypothetical protein [Spirochaetota bacterium]
MELSYNTLKNILQSSSMENLSLADLEKLFREEEQISRHVPKGYWREDPRNGDKVLYNASRMKRPHDNIHSIKKNVSAAQAECIICQGKTTGVIDVAELSSGFTFINKNLYPALYPHSNPGGGKDSAYGLHFLQWTSSVHGNDWHNMSRDDCFVVMKRLAVLEGLLLDNETRNNTSKNKGESAPDKNGRGKSNEGRSIDNRFVIIIKNYGRPVGGSLSHGHQQILYSSIMPGAFAEDLNFESKHGESFCSFMHRENPENLIVKDYGGAVLSVPFFMKRPYHMILSVKAPEKRFLHQLDEKELLAVSRGWHDAAKAIATVMPEIGRETAYNIITHNGPGDGLYFEFLPYTQEMGGLEKLGFYICEGEPEQAVKTLKELPVIAEPA